MPKRQVFFSFHFKNDVWRAGQVRNMGVVEGNTAVTDNDWEEVKRKDDASIKKWIDNQLQMRSCTVVLIGSETADRKWIKYEIEQSWKLGKGVVGIYVHKLKDSKGDQCRQGKNPFAEFTFGDTTFDKIVKCYNPPYDKSEDVYNYIARNIDSWVEEAIKIRNRYQ